MVVKNQAKLWSYVGLAIVVAVLGIFCEYFEYFGNSSGSTRDILWMRMKRCVSTQTWQPVTANLTLPFGTVSWLHFSSKPWRGSAFTSFLQLFFVASITMVAPWWWHRKEAFLQASLHAYDLTMANFCMELFTEVVLWRNLAFLLISVPFDLDFEQDTPWLSTILYQWILICRMKNLISIWLVCATGSPLLPTYHLLWLNSKKLSISDMGCFLQRGVNLRNWTKGFSNRCLIKWRSGDTTEYLEELH